MIPTDPAMVAPSINAEIANAERILLLTHTNPDGDAIGSMLGMWHVLQTMGKHATPLASSTVPEFLGNLPGIEEVIVYERGSALPTADLVIMMDTASLPRVGSVYDDHAASLEALPLIVIDHHVTNTGPGQINLIDPNAASTAELIYCLLHEMRAPITPEVATCLLMGLTTDTQSFQTNSTRPQSLRIAADMIEAGADRASIVDAVYFSTPYGTAHLLGLSLSQIQREKGLIWTHITLEMERITQADDDAYDAVTAILQRIAGMSVAVLFRERGPEEVKISLRSQLGIDVASIARIWGGGGHMHAAGATVRLPLAEAKQEVLAAVRDRLASK
jgi:phosphoesterase RecJ-like protein